MRNIIMYSTTMSTWVYVTFLAASKGSPHEHESFPQVKSQKITGIKILYFRTQKTTVHRSTTWSFIHTEFNTKFKKRQCRKSQSKKRETVRKVQNILSKLRHYAEQWLARTRYGVASTRRYGAICLRWKAVQKLKREGRKAAWCSPQWWTHW